jgi:diadenosine tetraphosphate (Ap4A) HIT family hydrolase
MSDESAVLPTPLIEYKHEHVYPAFKEFNAAVERGNPTEDEGRRYINALREYGAQVDDFPGAPGWLVVDPKPYDAAARRGMEAELKWIGDETNRIIKFFGGALNLEG